MTDEEINLLEIGKRITERRKKLGMTQEMLAEKGDLTPQFVSYAESGKRAMRPENVIKLAKALEVSADYLLGLEAKRELDTSQLSALQISHIQQIIDDITNRDGDKQSAREE